MTNSHSYESQKLLTEYLLFHYGSADDIAPPDRVRYALDFPRRSVECFIKKNRISQGRALDLGCAVGGASFALTRYFTEVIGLDASKNFIKAASGLKRQGKAKISRHDSGLCTTPRTLLVPDDCQRKSVKFIVGDAQSLPLSLGKFNFVLMANLIDRLPNPAKCLRNIHKFLLPGGRLVITTPFTWLQEFTPRRNWIQFGDIRDILSPHFLFVDKEDLPFLIREHARKFQLSLAQATCWIRKQN